MWNLTLKIQQKVQIQLRNVAKVLQFVLELLLCGYEIKYNINHLKNCHLMRLHLHLPFLNNCQ